MSRSLTLISSSKYDEKLSTEVTINMNKKDKVWTNFRPINSFQNIKIIKYCSKKYIVREQNNKSKNFVGRIVVAI